MTQDQNTNLKLDVKGKKVLVLGAGKSGVSSTNFLTKKGALVALYDKKDIKDWSKEARSLKKKYKVVLIDGKISSLLLDQIDLVVVSPGVPMNAIPARYVDRKNGHVIGEVELAYRFMKGRIVGITGSNGKTTTTDFIGKLLKNGGIETRVGGNIGTPLLSMAEDSFDECWTVAELSSFQLETIKDFRPRIGICLNVTPNHMDRYNLFTDYAAAKHRLFMNQTSEDLAILNADDETTLSWVNSLKANVTLFSTNRELDEGLFLRGCDLICRADGGEKKLLSRNEIRLRGIHNVQNILAGLAVGLACGVSLDSMRQTVHELKAVEHRLEFVSMIEGISFYNDSKATSVDAALKALEALSEVPGKIVLILGGLGKNAPYEPLKNLVKRNVNKLVLIGEESDNIELQLKDYAEIIRADSMRDAVRKSFGAAAKGDTVLLAPACASFDMFRSFEERGAVFKKCVQHLESEILDSRFEESNS